jgi:AAA+ superfamily predicted ATPase
MSELLDPLRSALNGRSPILYICTPEEDRVTEMLETLLPEYAPGGKVSAWTCTTGLIPAPQDDKDTRDPVAALRQVTDEPGEGFYVFKDLSEFIEKPEVTRALRNAYHGLLNKQRTFIVIVSPVLVIPQLLEREISRIILPLPTVEDLVQYLGGILAGSPQVTLPPETLSEIALSLRGLTLQESGHVMHRILRSPSITTQNALELIFAEKKALADRANFLEFVPNRTKIEDVGGLSYMKEWALKRKGLFTQEAVKTGQPVPKGILIMGISGCGKSLSAKAISCLWRVPLFRLDMNLVFSGLFGNPEASFHRTLKTIESIAPAVLWIDEIENALGLTVDEATPEQSLIFSSFLTWMQERPPLVFVAATANRIERLPAEIIRKGRFDEVFFCDLPSVSDRQEIIEIHLRINGSNLGGDDVERILALTDGWTGAEIEQAIISARVQARSEDRDLTFKDVLFCAGRMVPLSQTMAEQISAIRNWAYNRASRASKEKPRQHIPGL